MKENSHFSYLYLRGNKAAEAEQGEGDARRRPYCVCADLTPAPLRAGLLRQGRNRKQSQILRVLYVRSVLVWESVRCDVI